MRFKTIYFTIVSFQVIAILSKVLKDNVHGELMQLQNTENLEDRFWHLAHSTISQASSSGISFGYLVGRV